MQTLTTSDVKMYNLSAGKSLQEWFSERKKQINLNKEVRTNRRIKLIQNFDMPGHSTQVKVSRDKKYILATGVYKPRVKCFDCYEKSLKFERYFDSEAVTFEILSSDCSKLVFLQSDRYIEFHSENGRFYRLKIPKYGRDMKYHHPNCDLYVVGVSPDIYRLNLERGQFQIPYISNASSINKCDINLYHNLLVCGTQEGTVEAWDPRTNSCVGLLDCAFNCLMDNNNLEGCPSVTAIKCNDALQFGVGTATGQVLLYDLRANKPFSVKDHKRGLPIKDIVFNFNQDLVFSMDSSILKIWDKNKGTPYTSIEASSEFNNLCQFPISGLLFIANENTNIKTYYIPRLGRAPPWAQFLEWTTEELEENNVDNEYDDFKFVTKQELEGFGLDHLTGTSLLRAYMHGYFMDVKLYKKAKSNPKSIDLNKYCKKKIRQTIKQDKVKNKKLPKVNKDLAIRLMNDQLNKKRKDQDKLLLNDSRFKALFENPDFQIDTNADEYRLLNSVMSRLGNERKELKKKNSEDFEIMQEEFEGKNSSEESKHSVVDSDENEDDNIDDVDDEEGSSDSEHNWRLKVNTIKKKRNKVSSGETLQSEVSSTVKLLSSVGNRKMPFSTSKKGNKIDQRNKKRKEQRKKIVRPAHFKSRLKSFSDKKK